MVMLTEKILEALQTRAEITVDLFSALFSDRATLARTTRRFHFEGPKRFKHDWADLYRKRHAFRSLLSHLKREGLIVKTKDKDNARWGITKKGTGKLRQYHTKIRHPGGIAMRRYPQEKITGLVIVAFDIPEKMRKKRDWLRENLIALGLTLLQKSVWVGTTAIPQEFITDVRAQKILPHVHIFSVNRRGTIEQTI